MIEAMGGKKALAAVKDTTITGTIDIIQAGLTEPLTIYQKEPNKLRVNIEITENGMTFIQAFDGQKGWGTNMQTMAIEEFSDVMTKEVSHQALGNDAFLDPQKLGITFALKPKVTLEGKDYLVLEQTLSDGYKITMFIDPATYLVYKTAAKSLDPTTGGEIDGEAYFSDYRKVGGLMVAFSSRQLTNGTESMRMTFTNVTFNTNLDDSLFIMK
jgi:outer membrane lipoprotein-sorting protein